MNIKLCFKKDKSNSILYLHSFYLALNSWYPPKMWCIKYSKIQYKTYWKFIKKLFMPWKWLSIKFPVKKWIKSFSLLFVSRFRTQKQNCESFLILFLIWLRIFFPIFMNKIAIWKFVNIFKLMINDVKLFSRTHRWEKVCFYLSWRKMLYLYVIEKIQRGSDDISTYVDSLNDIFLFDKVSYSFSINHTLYLYFCS